MDPLHTQWALVVPWDPESTLFGPFRNPTHVLPISIHHQVKCLFPCHPFILYCSYLRRKHSFCLCPPSCPGMAQHYCVLVSHSAVHTRTMYFLSPPFLSLVDLLCFTSCCFTSFFFNLFFFHPPSTRSLVYHSLPYPFNLTFPFFDACLPNIYL